MSDQWRASLMSFDDWVKDDRERIAAQQRKKSLEHTFETASARIHARIGKKCDSAFVEIAAMSKQARRRNSIFFREALKEIQQAA